MKWGLFKSQVDSHLTFMVYGVLSLIIFKGRVLGPFVKCFGLLGNVFVDPGSVLGLFGCTVKEADLSNITLVSTEGDLAMVCPGVVFVHL